MKKSAGMLITLLMITSLALAASQEPRHPLSHINPTDTDFNMSGYQIFNSSSFELQDGLNFSGNSIYDQGNIRLLQWDTDNREWDVRNADFNLNSNSIINPGLLSMQGNIDMNGFNITEIDTLSFLTGMRINGSIKMSGGNIDLDNGSIKDVYSINGGGNSVNFLDSIDMNGNVIKDSNGDLEFDTRIYIPNNELDMAGNNIVNPGNVDGVDLDFPGNGLRIAGSRYEIVQNGIGNTEINNSQVFTSQGLDVSGGNITRVDTLLFEEGGLIDGDISINGSINTSGSLDLNNNDLNDVRSIDGGSNPIRYDSSINLNNNNLIAPNQIQTGGQNIEIRDTTNNLSVASFNEGGKVEIYNGNLDLQGNSIVDTTGSNTVNVGDGSNDEIVLDSGNGVSVQGGNLDMNQNNITNFFENACEVGEAIAGVDDDGGYYCVDIAEEVSDVYVNRSGDSMTGDLDMQGNDIYDIQRQGIGTDTPQENLDVDGSASIENSGTRMEVDSSGNVVVTLGS
jgi:hypothetical protein